MSTTMSEIAERYEHATGFPYRGPEEDGFHTAHPPLGFFTLKNCKAFQSIEEFTAERRREALLDQAVRNADASPTGQFLFFLRVVSHDDLHDLLNDNEWISECIRAEYSRLSTGGK